MKKTWSIQRMEDYLELKEMSSQVMKSQGVKLRCITE